MRLSQGVLLTTRPRPLPSHYPPSLHCRICSFLVYLSCPVRNFVSESSQLYIDGHRYRGRCRRHQHSSILYLSQNNCQYVCLSLFKPMCRTLSEFRMMRNKYYSILFYSILVYSIGTCLFIHNRKYLLPYYYRISACVQVFRTLSSDIK